MEDVVLKDVANVLDATRGLLRFPNNWSATPGAFDAQGNRVLATNRKACTWSLGKAISRAYNRVQNEVLTSASSMFNYIDMLATDWCERNKIVVITGPLDAINRIGHTAVMGFLTEAYAQVEAEMAGKHTRQPSVNVPKEYKAITHDVQIILHLMNARVPDCGDYIAEARGLENAARRLRRLGKQTETAENAHPSFMPAAYAEADVPF